MTRWWLWVGVLALVLGFLLLWPAPASPKAFEAPENVGLAGPFAPNTQLQAIEHVNLGAGEGPEDGALGPDGDMYFSLRNGDIVRLKAGEDQAHPWVNTGGAPLGLEFGPDGTLWVADAYRGLLSITPEGAIEARSTQADGTPIRFADDVDVSPAGLVYFTDASTKFGAKDHGGPMAASYLDTVEHGRYGRLLRYDPKSGTTTVLRTGLAFANGVAIDDSGEQLYLAETGENRVLSLELRGERAGTWGILIDSLPGFPDNVEIGQDGRIWLGLVAPRDGTLDATAGLPALRAVALRLPEFLRPQPKAYGHLVALDAEGHVLKSLQDPSGGYHSVTGALETPDAVYVTSLDEAELGELPGWSALGGAP